MPLDPDAEVVRFLGVISPLVQLMATREREENREENDARGGGMNCRGMGTYSIAICSF